MEILYKWGGIIVRKGEPTKEEIELIVAAGDDPELKARVRDVKSLNNNADSCRASAIYQGIFSGIWVTATLYSQSNNENGLDPIALVLIASYLSIQAYRIIRLGIRSKEYREDAQDEREDILALSKAH